MQTTIQQVVGSKYHVKLMISVTEVFSTDALLFYIYTEMASDMRTRPGLPVCGHAKIQTYI
jgi:hypothetical protein